MSSEVIYYINTGAFDKASGVTEKFDVNKLNFILEKKKVDEITKSGAKQFSVYPKYEIDGKNRRLSFATGEIVLNSGGIPKKVDADGEAAYFSTDKGRAFINIIFNEENKDEQPSLLALSNFLKKLDARLQDLKSSLYQHIKISKSSTITQYSIVTSFTPKSDENVTLTKIKMPIKYKFGVDEIDTLLFHTTENGIEEVNVKQLSDIEGYIRIGCKFRIIFSIQRVWMSRAKLGGSYGFGMKLQSDQILIKEHAKSQEKKLSSFAFEDEKMPIISGDKVCESLPKEINEKESRAPQPMKKIVLNDAENSDEEDDDDDDDDGDC